MSEVDVLASLSTTDSSLGLLKELSQKAARLTQRHLQKHIETGLELEDWNDVVTELADLTNRYEQDVNSGDH